MKPIGDFLNSYGATLRATPGELAVDPMAGTGAGEPQCERCGGTGWLADRTAQNLPFTVMCPCLAAKVAAREAAQQRREHDLLLARLQQSFGRLAACSLQTFDVDRPLAPVTWNGTTYSVDEQRALLQFALSTAAEYANGASAACWLYLYGPCGSGKTHLAAAIVRALVENGLGAAYASVPELLGFIRAGFADNSAAQRLELLKTVDVLLLDDLGAEQATEWVLEQLFILVNSRYLAERRTLITSNVRLDALPPRVASRIAELADEVLLPIADYRRRERA